MTEVLDERQYIFSQHGWNKLAEVPPDVYMPVIFVIIDEFSDMSQILQETKGLGYAADYTIKLENLLKRGAALGFKFIFASQTYTTGVSGLTEMACKQIQLRFALKNTPDEIKQTLMLSEDNIPADISAAISDMPVYETLFKWRDTSGVSRVGKFRNLYSEDAEQNALIDMIQSGMHVLQRGERESELTYRYKAPVLIEGNEPKTFGSQVGAYKTYESRLDPDELDPSDILLYAGVPCSFNLVRPFTMVKAISENILVAGGSRENNLSVALSVCNSYGRKGRHIEIWAHERNSTYKKFKGTVLKKYNALVDMEDICDGIARLRHRIEEREEAERLIVVFGYENMISEMEILGADGEKGEANEAPKPAAVDTGMDMAAVLKLVQQTQDPEEKKRIMEQYKKQAQVGANQERAPQEPAAQKGGIYDAREDFKWVLKRASNFGIHFMLVFEQAKDFLATDLDAKSFQHKILFSMSCDDSNEISGSRKANELGDGMCLYTNGKDTFTMRPHLYKGVPCNGWMVDDNNQIVQRR